MRDLRGLTWPARRVYPWTVRLREGGGCRQGANESESEELVRYIPHECSAPSGLRPGAMRESAPDQLRSLKRDSALLSSADKKASAVNSGAHALRQGM